MQIDGILRQKGSPIRTIHIASILAQTGAARMTTTAQEFLRKAATKSADGTHRQIIRKNIDSYDVAVARGRARFQNWQLARERAQAIKKDAIDHLDHYLERFEAAVQARGGHVYWAETAEQARQYVLALAAKHKVKTVSKAKSMVAEEIHLAPALEEQGIQVFETDLGEFIVQLRKEPPYHIVTPAMHLNRQQIAELFKEKLGGIDTDDPEKLVGAARVALRRAFFSAEMGITGANFSGRRSGPLLRSPRTKATRTSASLCRAYMW